MARYIDSPDLYLRKGKKVRVRIYGDYKIIDDYVGIIAETPRLDGGRFASSLDLVDRPYKVEVKVRMDNGHIKTAYGDDCYPMRDTSELTYDDWVELRKEIKVGSVFIGSYENSFGIDPKLLCDMCDAYLEENPDIEDTPDNFARYMEEFAPCWS